MISNFQIHHILGIWKNTQTELDPAKRTEILIKSLKEKREPSINILVANLEESLGKFKGI